MSPSPPVLAVRILAGACRCDPAAPAILGDVHEDFVRLAHARGLGTARRWYWREALRLATGRFLRNPLKILLGASEMNPTSRLGALLQDGAWALRSIRRSPGFALFTAAVIGLGVGASTAVFSVLKPLVLAPLPFEEPGRLVWIANQPATSGGSLSHVTSRSGNLRDFRERAASFEGLTGYNAFSEQTAFTLTGTGDPERLVGFAVAHDILEVLGVQPLRGRGFSAEEGAWGGPPAVILSNGFWRTHFASDPGIVGRALTLNDMSATVVGVLPAEFDFSSVFTPGVHVDFLYPYPVSEETDRHGNEMVILGRMRPGVTAEAAQADLEIVLEGLREEQPDRWGLSAHVTPLQQQLAGPFRAALLRLVAAAGTHLLIVCVHVSNLVLTRAPGRAREVAVRKALGATRGRLARQMVLESTGIALVGAGVGGVFAWIATRQIAATTALRIPLLDHVRMDAMTLLFGTAVALLTGLVVSVVPALHVTEGGEAAILRASGRGRSADRRARRLREVLVVAEVMLACVLLVFGGLLVRSFRAVLDVDLGFDPAEAVAWQLNPTPGFEDLREKSNYFATLADRVAQIPGVEGVGLIDALPLGRNRNWGLRLAELPDEEENWVGLFPHIVDPGYLPSMHIALVAGRNFTQYDTGETQRVVLLNESGARRVFGGDEPLGRRIRLSGEDWEVVGIAQDVRHVSPEDGPGVQVYMSMRQMGDFRTMDMVVRSGRPTDQIAGAVAAALREVDAAMPTREFWTVRSTVDRAVSARRFTLGILTAYGAAALLLAALGIYGVLAQSVSERTHEIAIRMALGASGSGVVRGILAHTLALAGIGIGVGALVSLGGARLVASLLYGVGATDPVTFIGMALVLLLVAAAAGALPAAQAAHTRGLQALGTE